MTSLRQKYSICLGPFTRIAKSNKFNVFIILMIVSNTIIIATDKHPITNFHSMVLEYSNYVFYTIFTLEMVIKLLGLGFRVYIKDRFNIFDSILVLLNTVDIILSLANVSPRNGALSVFRGFRILRLLKLVK